jgi:hypothetical protein
MEVTFFSFRFLYVSRQVTSAERPRPSPEAVTIARGGRHPHHVKGRFQGKETFLHIGNFFDFLGTLPTFLTFWGLF